MELNFREWLLSETISLAQAAELFGYKPGDMIDAGDLKKRFRKLVMQHHPDREGDETVFKQVSDANTLLLGMIGRIIPTFRQRTVGQHWQTWQPPNPVEMLKRDIKDELLRAIAAIKKGQPVDAFAAVSRLVDPHTGKLNTTQTNPLLKTGLEQWLTYYNQGFHDYLEPILNNALKLV